MPATQSHQNNTGNRKQLREKVAKLLRQAEDQRGTPEGAIFEAKAFELMAKYGVEAAQLEDHARNQAIRKDVNFTGAYTELQFRLLSNIADTLHCVPIHLKEYNKRSVAQSVIFGLPHHIERAYMLYSILNPQMITGAQRFGDTVGGSAADTRRAKKSWMIGFIESIRARLAEIEKQYESDYARGHKSGSLVLVEDVDAAMNKAYEDFPFLSKSKQRSPTTIDPFGFQDGITQGKNMDLGQTRMQRNLGALPPVY